MKTWVVVKKITQVWEMAAGVFVFVVVTREYMHS